MKPILLITVILAGISCTTRMHAANVQEIIQADKDFSALSQQQGMRKAFLASMDSNAVMLSANHMPVVGNDLAKHYGQVNDSDFILTWEPLNGSIAKSGDLGYTYGVYTLKFKSSDTTAHQGTYTTIWKKQSNGTWKFVLDTGNEGLGK
jgi:ketosteroid isomerase-like protein